MAVCPILLYFLQVKAHVNAAKLGVLEIEWCGGVYAYADLQEASCVLFDSPQSLEELASCQRVYPWESATWEVFCGSATTVLKVVQTTCQVWGIAHGCQGCNCTCCSTTFVMSTAMMFMNNNPASELLLKLVQTACPSHCIRSRCYVHSCLIHQGCRIWVFDHIRPALGPHAIVLLVAVKAFHHGKLLWFVTNKSLLYHCSTSTALQSHCCNSL